METMIIIVYIGVVLVTLGRVVAGYLMILSLNE